MTIYTVEIPTHDQRPGDPHTVAFCTSRKRAEVALESAKTIWPNAFIWDYPANDFLPDCTC